MVGVPSAAGRGEGGAEARPQGAAHKAVIERPLGLLIARIDGARDPEPEGRRGTIEGNDGYDGNVGWRERLAPACPAELLELSEHLGSFALHGGRWRVRAAADRARRLPKPVESGGHSISFLSEFTVFADLRDGRQASYVAVRPLPTAGADYDWWVVILREDEAETDDTPVVAKGIRQFLERILDEGEQPFFDAPGYVPESTLGETERW